MNPLRDSRSGDQVFIIGAWKASLIVFYECWFYCERFPLLHVHLERNLFFPLKSVQKEICQTGHSMDPSFQNKAKFNKQIQVEQGIDLDGTIFKTIQSHHW